MIIGCDWSGAEHRAASSSSCMPAPTAGVTVSADETISRTPENPHEGRQNLVRVS